MKKNCYSWINRLYWKTTLSIISKNIKDFEILLLSTNKNIKEINKQCKNLSQNLL